MNWMYICLFSCVLSGSGNWSVKNFIFITDFIIGFFALRFCGIKIKVIYNINALENRVVTSPEF